MPDATPLEAVGALPAILEHDRAARALGIRLVDWGPGCAVLEMTVRDDMTNGFAITHGGFVFALADTAFAVACNDGVSVTVASGADIAFVRSTTAGQVLTATATCRSLSGRTGIYDVTVTDDSGDVVAEFRGRSFTTNRPLRRPEEEVSE